MIHPLSWSVDSLLNRVRKNKLQMLSQDRYVYGLLPVKGQVVLDLGAYDGDSARFFLERGARKIIAVEPVPEYCDVMRYMRNVEVRQRRAMKCDLLSGDYDVCKCDIEGYESEFLDLFVKPTVIEYHNYWIREQLLNHGFKERAVLVRGMVGQGLMTNF